MRVFSFTKNISNRRADFVIEFARQFRLKSFVEAVTFLQGRRTRRRLANVSTAPESFWRAVDFDFAVGSLDHAKKFRLVTDLPTDDASAHLNRFRRRTFGTLAPRHDNHRFAFFWRGLTTAIASEMSTSCMS